MTARFAPDGSIVYGAAWEDEPAEIFAAHPPDPEARPLGLADADLLSVSPNGELAVSLAAVTSAAGSRVGTLARRPFGGGAPRPSPRSVQEAEWTPRRKEPADHPPRSAVAIASSGRLDASCTSRRCGSATCANRPAATVSHSSNIPCGETTAARWSSSTAPGSSSFAHRPGQHRRHRLDAERRRGLGVGVGRAAGSGHDLRRHQHVGSRANRSGRSRAGFTARHRAGRRRLLAFENAGAKRSAAASTHSQERNLTWFDWSWLATSVRRRQFDPHRGAGRGGARAEHHLRPPDRRGPAVRIGEGHARGTPFTRDGGVVIHTGKQLEILPVGVGEPRVIPLAAVK